jgi:succinylarginine dihydrolase
MTALTTPHQISTYRLATLRTALKLEKLGMYMSRGPTALSILRGMGYKGNRDKILAQVTKDVADAMAAME